jgi:hypothetical protein
VEEIYLDVPPRAPELLHAPYRRGKKRMRMQRLPARRYDAEASASAASLFLSLPQPAQWEEIELCVGEGKYDRTHGRSNTEGAGESNERASSYKSDEIKEGGGKINKGEVAIREGMVVMADDNEA